MNAFRNFTKNEYLLTGILFPISVAIGLVNLNFDTATPFLIFILCALYATNMISSIIFNGIQTTARVAFKRLFLFIQISALVGIALYIPNAPYDSTLIYAYSAFIFVFYTFLQDDISAEELAK
ncbi:hypothetical protein [Candidatus Synchoanobacter obligatus]|uniref:Uncharacterized protein n=1 Tax=Candidatus Synchoanobacter obligatus TaxID=2919597 RepID=A0ABT1L357_9GAMM|nr:hypothetical protein [Candidatus Synchoanobacter obligatus]MCP8351697.1 hypothetical protein [Candidatus Synchoanobacter obligatus]